MVMYCLLKDSHFCRPTTHIPIKGGGSVVVKVIDPKSKGLGLNPNDCSLPIGILGKDAYLLLVP